MSQAPYPIQVDHEFKRKWNRYSFWAGLFILAGLGATMIDLFQSNQFGLTGSIGFGSFALGIFFMNRRCSKELKNYTCPNCLADLQTTQNRLISPHQYAVMFDCDDCKITWDTSLRENED